MSLEARLGWEATHARRLIIEMTTKAGSGHPTSSMSQTETGIVLFYTQMVHDIENPDNPNADVFVWSKGHAAPLLYALMAKTGYIPEEELGTLRQTGSRLEGHPTMKLPGIVYPTGSLGQGLSVAVGQAIADRLNGLDRRVFALLGDGECDEGAIWEAAMSAPHHALDRLIVVVDRNRIQQSGRVNQIMGTDPLDRKFEAFGWLTQVCNGHDIGQLLRAFEWAVGNIGTGQPSIIVAETKKGRGFSKSEDVLGRHGRALPPEERDEALEKDLALTDPPPGEPIELKRARPAPSQDGSLGSFDIPPPAFKVGEKAAAREGFRDGLVKLGAVNPRVLCVTADMSNSTFSDAFMEKYPERSIEFGIAEQNMIGAAQALARSGFIPVVNSFCRFMVERPVDQIEVTAYSGVAFPLVGSHPGLSSSDQDGVTQMGLMDCAIMRSIHNTVVCNAADAVAGEKLFIEVARYRGGLGYLRCFKNPQDVIYPAETEFPLGGAHVLRESDDDAVTVAATGWVVHEALEAYETLKGEGIAIRVIDAYSLKPVARDVLLEAAEATGGRIITVEDHNITGGLGDAVLEAMAQTGVRVTKMGVTRFPESGLTKDLLRKFGCGADNVVQQVKALLGEAVTA